MHLWNTQRTYLAFSCSRFTSVLCACLWSRKPRVPALMSAGGLQSQISALWDNYDPHIPRKTSVFKSNPRECESQSKVRRGHWSHTCPHRRQDAHGLLFEVMCWMVCCNCCSGHSQCRLIILSLLICWSNSATLVLCLSVDLGGSREVVISACIHPQKQGFFMLFEDQVDFQEAFIVLAKRCNVLVVSKSSAVVRRFIVSVRGRRRGANACFLRWRE